MSEAPGLIDRLQSRLRRGPKKPQTQEITTTVREPRFFNYSFSETRQSEPRLEPEEKERLEAMRDVVLEAHRRMMASWEAGQTLALLHARKVKELKKYLGGEAPWKVREVYLQPGGKGLASYTRDLDVFEQSGDRIRGVHYRIRDITDKLGDFLVNYVSEDYPVLGEPHQAILIGRKEKQPFEVIGTAQESVDAARPLGKSTSEYLQDAGFTEIHGVELVATRPHNKLPSAYGGQ